MSAKPISIQAFSCCWICITASKKRMRQPRRSRSHQMAASSHSLLAVFGLFASGLGGTRWLAAFDIPLLSFLTRRTTIGGSESLVELASVAQSVQQTAEPFGIVHEEPAVTVGSDAACFGIE